MTFASDLEHRVGIGAAEIGEGHVRPRGQCEQRRRGGEVIANVKCVLHMCGLIVICQPWVFGCCPFSPKERVGFFEDAGETMRRGERKVTWESRQLAV